MNESSEFRAFVASKGDDGFSRGVRTLPVAALPEGEVTIEVAYSGVNYKDGLAATEKGRVAKIDELAVGIDLAGTVAESSDPGFAAGDKVIAHGYEIGVGRHGGFAELARVPAGWVVPLPAGLTLREAATIGTAGFTAAMSVRALRRHGIAPGDGEILVLGATGGVGSVAVATLAALGYEVAAVTGKADAAEWLRGLGATTVLDRSEAAAESPRPLEKQRWAGAVDPVGGEGLAFALRTMRYRGAVACSGLAGSPMLETTVLPFIIRAVSILGIDSVEVPIAERREIWAEIGGELRPGGLDGDLVGGEFGLDEVEEALDRILAGGARGRQLVVVGGE
jgi:acrylyl-CoA reductase (NADPH)